MTTTPTRCDRPRTGSCLLSSRSCRARRRGAPRSRTPGPWPRCALSREGRRLLGVARSLALGQHPPQRGPSGGEERGVHPDTRCADWANTRPLRRSGRERWPAHRESDSPTGADTLRVWTTDRPRRELVQQGPGIVRLPAFDGGFGVGNHSGDPHRIGRQSEVCRRQPVQY